MSWSTPFCGRIGTEHVPPTRSFNAVNPSLIIVATVGATAALYLGRELFAPIVLALLLTALLRPTIRAFARLRVPPPVSATVVVSGVLGLVGAGVFRRAQPLGGVFMMALLAISAFATFESVGRVLLAPGAYLAISTIQNNAVSPFAYGNRLKLNPVVVLLATLVGWFLWGVAGAFVAIPVLATVKVLAEVLGE